MTIGIDISALQGPHRMRGIGFAIINFINNVSDTDKKNHSFVLFMFKQNEAEALALLNLETLNYSVRYLQPKDTPPPVTSNLVSSRWRHLLHSAARQLHELKDRYFGNSQITNTNDVDVFIQPDQSASLPRGSRKMKKILIVYDIIPYVLEWEYLWSYSTARLHGFSRKASLRVAARRWFYIKKLKINARRADKLLAISETTKNDFIKYAGVPATKIEVIHLGINPSSDKLKNLQLQRFHKSSWGYMPKPFQLDPAKPYILYVGGADRRRRLEDLVAAFNNLRGEAVEVTLVLSGDTMQGPDNIATEEIQGALKNSSYLDDIVFAGFTDDETRNWLYRHCLAFVYPSTYEGFGLPVLEAMDHGCPVVCYPNEAVKEVAGDLPIYADSHTDLYFKIKQLLNTPESERQSIGRRNRTHARKFTWDKTAREIIAAISF